MAEIPAGVLENVEVSIPRSLSLQDAAIDQMEADYSGLTISSPSDASGYQIVHKAQMTVRGYRTAVERLRVELKAPHVEAGRAIDAEAKRITARLEQIEERLKGEKRRIDDEREKAKREAEEIKARLIEQEIRQRVERENAEVREALEMESRRIAAEREELDRLRREAQIRSDAERRLGRECEAAPMVTQRGSVLKADEIVAPPANTDPDCETIRRLIEQSRRFAAYAREEVAPSIKDCQRRIGVRAFADNVEEAGRLMIPLSC